MKNDLYFWAQSLDNQAPDVIFNDGKELSDDESRQKLVSEIYEIPRSNIEVLRIHAAVTIRYNYSKFVIEAIPTQKDTVKRLAPIVIYGVLPNNFLGSAAEVRFSFSILMLKGLYRIALLLLQIHYQFLQGWVESVGNDIQEFVTKLDRTLDESALIAIKNGLSEILQKPTEDWRLNLFIQCSGQYVIAKRKIRGFRAIVKSTW